MYNKNYRYQNPQDYDQSQHKIFYPFYAKAEDHQMNKFGKFRCICDICECGNHNCRKYNGKSVQNYKNYKLKVQPLDYMDYSNNQNNFNVKYENFRINNHQNMDLFPSISNQKSINEMINQIQHKKKLSNNYQSIFTPKIIKPKYNHHYQNRIATQPSDSHYISTYKQHYNQILKKQQSNHIFRKNIIQIPQKLIYPKIKVKFTGISTYKQHYANIPKRQIKNNIINRQFKSCPCNFLKIPQYNNSNRNHIYYNFITKQWV